MNIEEIVEELEKVKGSIDSSISFESLDNLVRGGRLPKAVSVVTGLRNKTYLRSKRWGYVS